MADLAARSAFDGLLAPIGTGQGVTMREVAGFGLATILVRDSAALGAALSASLPAGPVCTHVAQLTLLGTSRSTWLAFGNGGPAFAQSLTEKPPSRRSFEPGMLCLRTSL